MGEQLIQGRYTQWIEVDSNLRPSGWRLQGTKHIARLPRPFSMVEFKIEI